MAFISTRARDNLKPNKSTELACHAIANQYERDTNPNGIVALAVPEICEHINKHSKMTPWLLVYHNGFTGSKALKVVFAKFINGHFALRKKSD